MPADFAAAPLIYAGCRVAFVPPLPLNIDALVRLKALLDGSFSSMTDSPRIEVPPGRIEPSFTGPLAGMTFVRDDGVRVSVQADLIISWWAKSEQSGSRYPRFAALEAALWQVAEAFFGLHPSQAPRVGIVNMSYTDLIIDPQLTGDALLRKYFAESLHLGLVHNAPAVHNMNVQWRDQDGTDFRFTAEPAPIEIKDLGEKVPALAVEWAVGHVMEDKEMDARAKLRSCHERLNALFVQVLSDEAKREWGLKWV